MLVAACRPAGEPRSCLVPSERRRRLSDGEQSSLDRRGRLHDLSGVGRVDASPHRPGPCRGCPPAPRACVPDGRAGPRRCLWLHRSQRGSRPRSGPGDQRPRVSPTPSVAQNCDELVAVLLRSLPNRFLLQLEAKTLFACRSVDTRRYPNYVHVPLPSNPTKPHTTMRNRLETAETGARPKGPSEQGKRLLVQVGRSGRAALSTQGSAVRTRHRSLAKAAGQGRFSEVCRGPGSVRIGAVQHMCSRNDESCSTISRPASRSSAPPKTDQPSF